MDAKQTRIFLQGGLLGLLLGLVVASLFGLFITAMSPAQVLEGFHLDTICGVYDAETCPRPIRSVEVCWEIEQPPCFRYSFTEDARVLEALYPREESGILVQESTAPFITESARGYLRISQRN